MNSSINHEEMLSTVFPSVGMRVLSNIISIFGVSACAFCFARRSASVNLFSWRTLTSMSWARMCVYLLFLDSWVFIATSWILINGIGMSRSTLICSLGIYACIFAYASTKFLIYLFLTEKVHVVWGKGKNVPRLASPVYRICAVVLLIYIAVFVIIIVGKVAFLRDDQTCVIGLKPWASIPLLTYDLVVNILLTGLFLWPMFTSDHRSARLRRVTTRTLIAALASLATSTINILILTLMHGHQLGWVCLGSCGADVIVNAVVVYWVTEAPARSSVKEANVELTNIPNTPNTPKFVISSGSVTSPTRASRMARAEREWDSDDEYTDPQGGVSTDTGSRSITSHAQGAAFTLTPPPKRRDSVVVGGSVGPSGARTVTFGGVTASIGSLTATPNAHVSVTTSGGRQGFMGSMLNGFSKKRDRERERAVDHTASLSEPQSPIRITVTKEVMDEDQASQKSKDDVDSKA